MHKENKKDAIKIINDSERAVGDPFSITDFPFEWILDLWELQLKFECNAYFWKSFNF